MNGVFGILPAKFPDQKIEILLDEILAVLSFWNCPVGIIGGDHLATWTSLQAIHRCEKEREVVHVQVDAHHDLYSDGNAKAPVNPANFNLDLLRSGSISALATVGSRDTRSHIDEARREGLLVVDEWKELLSVKGGAHWHLSVDVDVLDPNICPGVTNPLPNGWALDRLLMELKALFKSRMPDSVSLVEATSESSETILTSLKIKSEIDRLYEYYGN